MACLRVPPIERDLLESLSCARWILEAVRSCLPLSATISLSLPVSIPPAPPTPIGSCPEKAGPGAPLSGCLSVWLSVRLFSPPLTESAGK